MENHGALRYGSTKVRRNYEDPDELCFVVVCLFLYTGSFKDYCCSKRMIRA